MSRYWAEIEAIEEVDTEWGDLRRIEQEIRWLDRRIGLDLGLAPELIVGALGGQRELRQAFLLMGSWGVVRDDAEADRYAEPPVADVAGLWSALKATEEAVGWLDAWLYRGNYEAPELIHVIFDAFIDLWEEVVAAASALPKEQLDA